ncbi:MAG: malonic semialdehyde reductase [Woeseiaceae bacterium]
MPDARALAQQEIRDMRERIARLDADGIDLVLRNARSHYAWADRPVSDSDLEQIFDIMVEGPTSNNGHPIRILFAQSDAAKQRLVPALKGNNVEKVLSSPVCAIIGYDTKFYERFPELFPHEPEKMQMFIDNPKRCADDSFRNGTLQGAYFMIAARALGFDVGPISGFFNDIVDEEFFADTTIKSNFLCNVGYGDESAVWQKLPRPSFDSICTFI